MGLSTLRALVVNTNLRAFGVSATVTRPAPDDTPIETTIIWLTPPTEDVPTGASHQRRDAIQMLAIPRSAVPTVPRGTQVAVPGPLGGDVLTWRVDATDRVEADHVRVIVMPADA